MRYTQKRNQFQTAFVLFLAALSGPAFGQEQILLDRGPEQLPFAIDLEPGSVVSIDPETGVIRATPQNPDVCSTGTCTAEVTVEPLNLSPAVVEQGGQFTANLGSLGARECMRSGVAASNWNATWNLPADGRATFQLADDIIPGNYQLMHQCRNGSVVGIPASETLVVEPATSTPPPTPDGCDVPMRPAGWIQDLNIRPDFPSRTTRTWSEAFDVDFPNMNGRDIAIDENTYAALAFDPRLAPDGDTGQILGAEINNAVRNFIGSGPLVISISECPGDFRDTTLGNCLVNGVSLQSAFLWVKTGPSETRCVLPSASTLYLNISYRNQFGQWVCNPDGVTQCGNFLQD